MDIKLNRPQSIIHRRITNDSTIVMPWGRGIGKSWYLRESMLIDVATYDGQVRMHAMGHQRGIRCVLMLPTFKQAKDLHAIPLDTDLSPSGRWGFLGAKIDHTSWLVRFPGGSTIQLFGAENADTAARGLRIDKVCVDESDDVDPGIYDSVITPWFSEPWSMRRRMLAGTPKRGRYGLLYRSFIRGQQTHPEYRHGHFSLHATGYDAPETVDRAYMEQIREETPPEIFRREWLCDFDSAEGLVYSLFDASIHVRQPPSDIIWTSFVGGIDHGYEDPAAMLVIGIAGSGRDAVAWVLDEYYQQHKTISELTTEARRLNDQYPGIKWFADPSRPDSIAEYRRAGLNVRGADNALAAGIDAVADRLAVRRMTDDTRYAKLYVHPRCRNLIREFGLYKRKRDAKNRDRITDEIDTRNDHALDALRYAVFTSLGGASRSRHDTDGNSFGFG